MDSGQEGGGRLLLKDRSVPRSALLAAAPVLATHCAPGFPTLHHPRGSGPPRTLAARRPRHDPRLLPSLPGIILQG